MIADCQFYASSFHGAQYTNHLEWEMGEEPNVLCSSIEITLIVIYDQDLSVTDFIYIIISHSYI